MSGRGPLISDWYAVAIPTELEAIIGAYDL
jgi:hypothetical protein